MSASQFMPAARSAAAHLLRQARSLPRALMSLLMVASLMSCRDTTAPLKLTTLTVSLAASSIQVGQITQASATGVDQNGSPFTLGTVTWSTGSPALATVSTAGVVTGVAPGTVTVIATVGTVTAQQTLTVIPVPVASVTVSPATATIPFAGTQQYTAATLDAGNRPLTGRVVVWTTSNAAVASVNSSNGFVIGVAAGTATITASSEGKSGTATVTVLPPPVSFVVVTPTTSTFTVGATQQLTVSTLDATGGTLTGRVINWTSSNPAVATVNATTGLVTGVAVGTATITASTEGKAGTATVTVTPPPVATVVVLPATVSVAATSTVQLNVSTLDAAGAALTGRTVVWSTSNAAIATVNASTGLVTGVAVGTATITATSEGKSGTATVTVTPTPVASVVVTPATVAVAFGGTQQLAATTLDASGATLTGRTVTWTTSNASVATVSSSGLVTGVATGTATITATSEGKTATSTVTVAPPPVATVTVAPTGATIGIGGTQQYAATTKDAAGITLTGRTIEWSSSDVTIATVDAATGLARGVANGTVTITATSEGKTGTATITVQGTAFTTVVAALDHSCGLSGAGVAYCWGTNEYGQLGDATTVDHSTPAAVIQGTLVFSSLAAGDDYTCALTATGVSYCWGRRVSLDGSTYTRLLPDITPSAPAFTAITGGSYHTCGLTNAGAAYCWGSNAFGQLGDGTSADSRVPVAVQQGSLVFASISAGYEYTCGVTTSGAAYCWGWNSDGRLGDGTSTNRMTPVAVSGGIAFSSLTAGFNHTCGTTSVGTAYCWGYNASSQLGDGSSSTRLAPTAVSGGLSFASLVSGFNHTCGRTTAGAAYCWGRNALGALGDGTTSSHSTPGAVSGGIVFSSLSAGSDYSCGLTSPGTAYCWGYNFAGQVGDGSTMQRNSPVQVIRP